ASAGARPTPHPWHPLGFPGRLSGPDPAWPLWRTHLAGLVAASMAARGRITIRPAQRLLGRPRRAGRRVPAAVSALERPRRGSGQSVATGAGGRHRIRTPVAWGRKTVPATS